MYVAIGCVSVQLCFVSGPAQMGTKPAKVSQLATRAAGVVHAWVGQIVTFFATAPLAATWAP